jgi:large subunit ribosomal protein L30
VIDAEKELAKLAASAGRPSGKKAEKAEKTGRAHQAGKSATLTVRQVRSGICTPKDQKATLRGLGLRRPGHRVVRPDSPAIRGMVHKVSHLVEIEKS